MSPMQLHRTYGGCHADITRIDWSACGRFMAVASKDLTARVFSLDPIPGYQPATLSGHKDAPVAVFFTGGWRRGGLGLQYIASWAVMGLTLMRAVESMRAQPRVWRHELGGAAQMQLAVACRSS